MNKKDRWDICRTCGNTADVEIFGRDGVTLQLEEKINSYLPITVSKNDNLPLKLCNVCINRLENCHCLIVSTIEMNKTLEEVIKKEQIKNNSYNFVNMENNEDENFEDIDQKCVQPMGIMDINSADEEDCEGIVTVKEEYLEYGPVDVVSIGADELFDDASDELDMDKITEEDDGEENGKFQCSKCQRVFDSETKMRRHIFIQHNPREMECFHCFAKYESMLHFERHVATHFTRNEYLCDFCPTMFNRVSGLLDHLAKHKIDRQRFTCQECGKVLANRLSFTIHQRTHTGEKPHACKYCDRTFSQISSKQYHERTHTGETTHHCEFCGKGFNSKLTRDTHRRIHTGERPFGCKKCNATFRCLANLRQHEMVHAPVKPFQCEVCLKRFGRPEKVRVHMRTHTGERPYKCPICGRGFTQKNDMLKHTNVHNKPPRRTNSQMKNSEIVISIDNKSPQYKNVSIKELQEMCYDVSNSYESSENGNETESSSML
ncbi:zinc finger protein 354B-like [Melanaphis sacchari]|uniref:Zinc finger protein 879 n=2 Tax=Melanaphis sacchari TaxID=742174 RepID=A0A2H8U0I9_9HEMI|nr:zinc finger protein 354B-like [Melanaphis sacchari]XP_025208067.1 zinc finger protein 354B-like [Melanaphis sacchari]XP_025208069.1 zinc finger protein 354B-like [Melanaphis sacchari]